MCGAQDRLFNVKRLMGHRGCARSLQVKSIHGTFMIRVVARDEEAHESIFR